MKIGELMEQTKKYRLMVDADGVLVDFDKEMERIGFDPEEMEKDKKLKSKFWAKVASMARKGEKFWGVMDKMPDADALWDFIKDHNPEILTATGNVGNPGEEKVEWFEEHYPGTVVHLVKKSADKAAFAGPDVILIDDRKKSIEPWIAAGGIGILHTSAEDTIRQLKELGL